MQEMLRAFSFASASAGNSIAARIEIMAMTTRSSISVNAGAARDSSELPLQVFIRKNRNAGAMPRNYSRARRAGGKARAVHGTESGTRQLRSRNNALP